MHWQLIVKIVVTVAVVIAVTEISKRNSFWGAVLASLPLTSLLAFIWLYVDTGNTQQSAWRRSSEKSLSGWPAT